MAGDWIKIEKSTLRKPEIFRIARLLGVSPMHAFGACIAFWAWADDATDNGHLIGLDSAMLDDTVNVPGLAAALLDVQWLVDVGDGFQIAYFDRHNGVSAKKRSAENRRKADYRERHNVRPPDNAAWRRP